MKKLFRLVPAVALLALAGCSGTPALRPTGAGGQAGLAGAPQAASQAAPQLAVNPGQPATAAPPAPAPNSATLPQQSAVPATVVHSEPLPASQSQAPTSTGESGPASVSVAQPQPAPAPAPVLSDQPEPDDQEAVRGGPRAVPQQVTLADNGKTFRMKVNQTFALVLGGPPPDWAVTIDNLAVLSRVPNIAPIVGSQGVFRAHARGTAVLQAVGTYPCQQAKPISCKIASPVFQVTIVVR